MKLGFNEATCMKRSNVETDLRECEKHGYDFIELRLDMLQDYLTRHTLDDLKEFFQTRHLKPYALNAIDYLNFQTISGWNEVKRLFLFACEVARAINNPYIIVCPTRSDEMLFKTEEDTFIDTIHNMRELADIAMEYGVKLALEPVGEKNRCCRSLRQAYEIVQELDMDHVGLTLDCFNFYLHDKCSDIEYIRKIPKEKLFVFHINDAEDHPLGILEHCHRVMPGDGCIPVKEICNILKEIGYDGIASIELFRKEYWNMEPGDVIRIAAHAVKPFL
ncbi:MAG: sugar phosphate isomerase/epimerase [Eubacteriales bacterium]|nr:sugar phosphate isomerase/epimerase [Eubacteriales bacterium]